MVYASMRERLLHYLAMLLWTLTALIGISITIFLYLYLIDGNPPVVYELPWKMVQKEYHAGDYLNFEVKACREKQYPFTVYAQILDGFTVSIAPYEVAGFPAGCTTGVSGDIQIPEFLPAGEYRLTGINVFRINPIRTRSVTWETESFTILP